MKIKPKYIYLIVAVIAVIFLVVVANQGGGNDMSKNINDSELPQDDIHKALTGSGSTPNKANVNESFRHQLEMLEKTVNENPNDTAKMKEYADLLSAAHRGQDAVKYYKNILKVNPKRKDIHFQLMFTYYNLKDFVNAEKSAEQVLKLDPNDEEAMYNLGAINAVMGKTSEAKNIWNKLIKNYPKSESAKLAEESIKKL